MKQLIMFLSENDHDEMEDAIDTMGIIGNQVNIETQLYILPVSGEKMVEIFKDWVVDVNTAIKKATIEIAEEEAAELINGTSSNPKTPKGFLSGEVE